MHISMRMCSDTLSQIVPVCIEHYVETYITLIEHLRRNGSEREVINDAMLDPTLFVLTLNIQLYSVTNIIRLA